jgi:tetratricopeptide (TPR) repeat protein
LHAELGGFAEALKYGTEGLVVARRCHDRLLEANILINLGIAEAGLGRPAQALDYFDQAVAVSRDSGDRYHEALALFGTARLHRARSCEQSARHLAGQALMLLTGLGAEEVADVTAFLETEPAGDGTTGRPES